MWSRSSSEITDTDPTGSRSSPRSELNSPSLATRSCWPSAVNASMSGRLPTLIRSIRAPVAASKSADEAVPAHGHGLAKNFDLRVGSCDRCRDDAVLHRDRLHPLEAPQPAEIDRTGAVAGREIPDVDPLERRVGAVEPPGLVGHDFGPGLAGAQIEPKHLGDLAEFACWHGCRHCGDMQLGIERTRKRQLHDGIP